MNNIDKIPEKSSTQQSSVKNAAAVKKALSKIPEVKEKAQQSELPHSVKSDEIPISAGNAASTKVPLPETSEKQLEGIKTRHLNQKKEQGSSTQPVTNPESVKKVANIIKSVPKFSDKQPSHIVEPAKRTLKKDEPQSQPGITSQLGFAQDIASQKEVQKPKKVSDELAPFEEDLNHLLSKEVNVAKQLLVHLRKNLTKAELKEILGFLGCGESYKSPEHINEYYNQFLKQILIHSGIDNFIEKLGECECYKTNKKPLEDITEKLNAIRNDFTIKFDEISNLYRDVKLAGIPEGAEKSKISKEYSSGEYNLLAYNDYDEFIESLLSEGVESTMETLDDIIRSKIKALEQKQVATPIYSQTSPARKSEKKVKLTPGVEQVTFSKISKETDQPIYTTSSYEMSDMTARTYLDYTKSTKEQRTKVGLNRFDKFIQDQFDQQLETTIRQNTTPEQGWEKWLNELTLSLEAMTDNYLKEQQKYPTARTLTNKYREEKQQLDKNPIALEALTQKYLEEMQEIPITHTLTHKYREEMQKSDKDPIALEALTHKYLEEMEKLEENPIHLKRYEGVLKTVVDRNIADFPDKVSEIRIKIFTERLFNHELHTAIKAKTEFDTDWHNELKTTFGTKVNEFIERIPNFKKNKVRFENVFNNHLYSKFNELMLVDNYVKEKITQALLEAVAHDSPIKKNWFHNLKRKLEISLDTFIKNNSLSVRSLERKRYMELLDAQIKKYESEYNNPPENESDNEFDSEENV